MRARRLRAALAGAVVAVLAVPAAALADDAGSITKTSGDVTAKLEWDRADYGVANPRLSITRGGTRYDLTIADICAEGCILRADEPQSEVAGSMLKLADLDGDGDPEAIVDTFSGGAHCCLTARMLSWDGTGYQPKDIDWRDVSYEVEDADGDGRPELVGQDPIFAGAFTAFAASAFPPLVYRVDHGNLTDITKQFPKLVRADASALLKDIRKARKGDDIRGILAAYVADQYLLNKGSTGLRELDHQRKRGRISKSFKPYLLKKLHAWKYR